MNANRPLLRTIWRVLALLNAVAMLVLLVVSFFKDVTGWLVPVGMLQSVFVLPDALRDMIRGVRSPKPISSHVLRSRWPFLLLSAGLVGVFAWANWLTFGHAWMAVLVALGFGLPMFGSTASLALMEPGRRKDRIFLACMAAMLVVPVSMIIAFALVSGSRGG